MDAGTSLLQPTAPSMAERAGVTAGRSGMPGEPQPTAEHPSHSHPLDALTPRGALSHSQPCSSTQGSLSLVITVQPGLVSSTQHNRGSKLNEMLQ